MLRIIVVCFTLLAAVPDAHTEELQDFLKRTGIGNATTNDVDAHFHISVFVGGQALTMDRDEILKFWEQQKASGIKLAVDSFTILSKIETPSDDGKGGVISVVIKVTATEDVRGSIAKIESTSHFIDFFAIPRARSTSCMPQCRNKSEAPLSEFEQARRRLADSSFVSPLLAAASKASGCSRERGVRSLNVTGERDCPFMTTTMRRRRRVPPRRCRF